MYKRFFTNIENISYKINNILLIKDLNQQKNELNKIIQSIDKIKINFLSKKYYDNIIINLIKNKNYNNEIVKILNKTNKFENTTNDIIMNSIYYKNYNIVEKILYFDDKNIKKLFNEYYLKLSFFKDNKQIIYLPHKSLTFLEEILLKNDIEFNRIFVKFYNKIFIVNENKIIINYNNKIIKLIRDKGCIKRNENEIVINEENFNYYYKYLMDKKTIFIK